MKQRDGHIDYLKGIYILLMVIFHLVYVGDKYPYAKQVVYTFHMSAFLIISGYLANVNKENKPFALSVLWIFIPYAVMETGYVLMSAVLPVRESVSNLTIGFLLNKVFINPMGPYWYLHTLIISYIIYYTINKILFVYSISFFIVLGICLWVVSDKLKIVSMANVIYFMIGVIIRQCKFSFQSVFQPSFLAVVPLFILCWYEGNLNRYSLAGVIITYLSISFFLWTYHSLPNKISSPLCFIGKNTLSILLFSPLFTILSKKLVPLFAYDSSGLTFACVAVIFVVNGCFLIAWLMDKMNLSYFFCGKTKLLYQKA